MRNIEVIKIKSGRLKGEDFEIEGIVSEPLDILAFHRNMAAYNAISVDKYTFKDAPFYYGKIGHLGYVVALKDLESKPLTNYVMPKYNG